ncbi:MAG TPA: hypothetical protein VFQ48_01405, partial [Pseudonocardiaceae bacterium]|nr:hypothetical protein [Pseudonocardiaceae bacterium]
GTSTSALPLAQRSRRHHSADADDLSDLRHGVRLALGELPHRGQLPSVPVRHHLRTEPGMGYRFEP